MPAHAVQLTGFWMGVYPVTNEQYARFMAETGRRAPPSFSDRRFNDPAQPVVMVRWEDAGAFARWLTGKLVGITVRLPTEAEWEYAARGTDGRAYPWGNEAPSATRLNACGSECVAMARRHLNLDWKKVYDASDGWETTAPVGSFPEGVSPFGVLDMAGNVWEWTADWYGAYPAAAATNPRGATSGAGRALRGGAWDSEDAGHVRAADRDRDGASHRSVDVGFRCARGD
jgi:formylglycine-generating enzyme required for sulfatase activity